MSSSLRVINNRYIIGGGRAAEARGEGGRGGGGVGKGRRWGCERAAAHLRLAERGWRKRRQGRRRSPGRGGRGSDLHKYIEFIEMSLGIAARRILAAYQPPRRFIPSALAPLSRSRAHTSSPLSSPSPSSLSSSPSSLAFIKIAGLIYAVR